MEMCLTRLKSTKSQVLIGLQVQDLDRKVRRGRERLAQDVDLASLVPMSTEKAEQLATIEEKIKKLLEQSENLGEEGKVDEAQALMKKVIFRGLQCR